MAERIVKKTCLVFMQRRPQRAKSLCRIRRRGKRKPSRWHGGWVFGVLLDDLLDRGMTGLPVMGVLGVFQQGKRAGHVATIRPHLDAWVHARYRVSDSLTVQVLKLAGE